MLLQFLSFNMEVSGMKARGFDVILEDIEKLSLLHGPDDDMLFDIQFDLEREYLVTEACKEIKSADDHRQCVDMNSRLWSHLIAS